MKRVEAEKQVRQVRRVCKGPWIEVFTPALKEKVLKVIKDTELTDFTEEITPRLLVNALLAVGSATSKPAAGNVEALCRVRCGNDFNNVIISNPLDGKERSYKCPKCGIEGIYTAPQFTIEE